MITLLANDIQCKHCTMRIEKALNSANIKAEVSLENKSIKIDDKDKNEVMQILDDLGFPAKEI